MKFDSIIIGGGLAGLVCGLRLQKAGRRCAIISAGQSALHFSSGYFSFLDRTPDGKEAEDLMAAVGSLPEEHPYRKIGEERLDGYLHGVKDFFSSCGMHLKGNPLRNGYRLSPTGEFRPAWLSMEDFSLLETDSSPWKKVLIANIEGFLDFNTGFIAESLESKGTCCRTAVISLEEMQRLRRNPSEMRSTNIARVLGRQDVLGKTVNQIKGLLQDEDAVLLPAVFGMESPDTKETLEKALGREVFLVATMPPSVPGIRTQMRLRAEFEACGGEFLMGDTALSPRIEDSRVMSINTVNFGDINLEADNYVLATGSFFSKGLSATPEGITETVFGLDVIADAGRDDWYDTDFFGKQNYISYGVRTDCRMRCYKDGGPLENLYAAGSVIGGYNPLYEGSGAGTAIFTAMYAADNILSLEA